MNRKREQQITEIKDKIWSYLRELSIRENLGSVNDLNDIKFDVKRKIAEEIFSDEDTQKVIQALGKVTVNVKDALYLDNNSIPCIGYNVHLEDLTTAFYLHCEHSYGWYFYVLNLENRLPEKMN